MLKYICIAFFSFEKTRLKELAEIYPQYRTHLLKIVENSIDLLYFLNTNRELYSSLGFDDDRCGRICFYDKNMSGSYSIKKTLPVLSNLSYAVYWDLGKWCIIEKTQKNLRIT